MSAAAPPELLIHAGIAELRIAIVERGRMLRYWQEDLLGDDAGEGDRDSHVGEIIWGRVVRVLPAANAALVDIGQARAGFLSVRDIHHGDKAGSTNAEMIADHVREGEALLVQVIKDPMLDKGARVGTAISLAGRLLVFSPKGSAAHVSRSIVDETERRRLSEIAERIRAETSGGYVVRTAAKGAGNDALREDGEALIARWREIEASSARAEAPMLLHRDLPTLERALRDHGSLVARVVVDGAEAFAHLHAYAVREAPELVEKIVAHRGGEPLFEAASIEDEIASLMLSRVSLPSGGWISIERTEALTAIDVNSGRHGSGRGADAALEVNLEAAEVIARHIVLRGLGGLIVIDFIGLSDLDQRQRLVNALRDAMADGGAATQIAAVPGGGPVVMTRGRVREAHHLRHTQACSLCDGHGRLRSVAAIAGDIVRRAERHASTAPGKAMVVYAAPEIAAWLAERTNRVRSGLARRGAADFRIVADAARGRESFSVETL